MKVGHFLIGHHKRSWEARGLGALAEQGVGLIPKRKRNPVVALGLIDDPGRRFFSVSPIYFRGTTSEEIEPAIDIEAGCSCRAGGGRERSCRCRAGHIEEAYLLPAGWKSSPGGDSRLQSSRANIDEGLLAPLSIHGSTFPVPGPEEKSAHNLWSGVRSIPAPVAPRTLGGSRPASPKEF